MSNRTARRGDLPPREIAQRITDGFGAQLRRLRRARGMTQSELSNAASLTIDHIGKIERGDVCPKVMTLGQLAAGLRVPVGHLFGPLGEEPLAAEPDSLAALVDYLRQRQPEDAAFALSILRSVFDHHGHEDGASPGTKGAGGAATGRSRRHGQP